MNPSVKGPAAMPEPQTSIVGTVIGAVLAASEPARLLERHEDRLRACGPCRLIAVGKAAQAMVAAARPLLGDALRAGLVIVPSAKPGNGADPAFPRDPAIAFFEADHPLPTQSNLAAAEATAALVRTMLPDESLVLLLSGGASALLTLPAPGLTLDDLRAATDSLLRAGAPIDELNCVRKHCEQLKGGGLARLAAAVGKGGCPCVLALILSDVVGDKLEVIGSGPTAPDPTTYADALAVLERFHSMSVVPAITAHLRRGMEGHVPETLKPGDPAFACVENIIIGSNTLAVEAAAAELRRLGYEVVETRTGVIGEARDVGRRLASRVRELAEEAGVGSRPRAIVWGGETTVTVRGTGTGGRNQELALAAAIALDGCADGAVMSFATDGVDGNSDAAGAIVDDQTIADARCPGLDAQAALANNDSHTFFTRLEVAKTSSGRRMLIRTGPTGTNVNDVMIGLVLGGSGLGWTGTPCRS